MEGMDPHSDSSVMHGEYKVRGGKLVATEITAEDGRIVTASVFGDFFLEPDDALEDLDAALVGMPTDASAADLVTAISARLEARPEPVEMIGFDAEAVAIRSEERRVGKEGKNGGGGDCRDAEITLRSRAG